LLAQNDLTAFSFVCRYAVPCFRQEDYKNSAIADKPRDAFVHYAMAWLTP